MIFPPRAYYVLSFGYATIAYIGVRNHSTPIIMLGVIGSLVCSVLAILAKPYYK